MREHTTIVAAGGLVQNTKGEFLFIFRRGKWDLPKGKTDKGEKIEDAAISEVKEECGIGELEIICPLITTHHTYELNGEKIPKKTHWFLMKTKWKGKLIPQKTEDITEAIWADEKKVKNLLENTYDTIREVVQDFFHQSFS